MFFLVAADLLAFLISLPKINVLFFKLKGEFEGLQWIVFVSWSFRRVEAFVTTTRLNAARTERMRYGNKDLKTIKKPRLRDGYDVGELVSRRWIQEDAPRSCLRQRQ
jgi:hypothetical protein